MKIRDSLLIFNSITDSQIDYSRCQVDFILVISNERMNRLSRERKKAIYLARKTHRDIDLFGLANMRGYCFNNVNCMSASEFDKWVKNKL